MPERKQRLESDGLWRYAIQRSHIRSKNKRSKDDQWRFLDAEMATDIWVNCSNVQVQQGDWAVSEIPFVR